MILNDFECKACGDISEYRYKYKDKDELVCVACGSDDLSLLLSAPKIASLNTRGKVEDALKRRTVKDAEKYKERRLERAKEKHKGFI